MCSYRSSVFTAIAARCPRCVHTPGNRFLHGGHELFDMAAVLATSVRAPLAGVGARVARAWRAHGLVVARLGAPAARTLSRLECHMRTYFALPPAVKRRHGLYSAPHPAPPRGPASSRTRAEWPLLDPV